MAGINIILIATIVEIVDIIVYLIKHPKKGLTKRILRVVLVLGILAIVLGLGAFSGIASLSSIQ